LFVDVKEVFENMFVSFSCDECIEAPPPPSEADQVVYAILNKKEIEMKKKMFLLRIKSRPKITSKNYFFHLSLV